jgi:hypothetical protein
MVGDGGTYSGPLVPATVHMCFVFQQLEESSRGFEVRLT